MEAAKAKENFKVIPAHVCAEELSKRIQHLLFPTWSLFRTIEYGGPTCRVKSVTAFPAHNNMSWYLYCICIEPTLPCSYKHAAVVANEHKT